MNISKYARRHPVGFIIILTIVWIMLLLVFMIIASSVFHKPYGEAMTVSIGRLAVTVCVLLLAWRMDWLKASGISRSGSWRVWLLALGGLVYFVSASLYSFYGSIAFDFSSLLQLPDARTAVIIHFIAGLSEEILFRGLVLYALIRIWGNTTRGILGASSLPLHSLHLCISPRFSHTERPFPPLCFWFCKHLCSRSGGEPWWLWGAAYGRQ